MCYPVTLCSGEDASTVLNSSMMEGVHGDVPSYVADGEVVNNDFVSQLKYFAVTVREAVKTSHLQSSVTRE